MDKNDGIKKWFWVSGNLRDFPSSSSKAFKGLCHENKTVRRKAAMLWKGLVESQDILSSRPRSTTN